MTILLLFLIEQKIVVIADGPEAFSDTELGDAEEDAAIKQEEEDNKEAKKAKKAALWFARTIFKVLHHCYVFY